ncbi:MAG: rhodanese-like domain-containing protein [Armatimonadaceae bacterium]
MQTLTVNRLKSRLQAGDHLQLIDVRSTGEYAAGHIPGAANIPMDQAEARIADLRPSDPVVLVCQSGKRASLTCDLLQRHHPELLVLEGGTSAWVAEGMPVVQTTSTRWALERQVRLIAGLLVLVGTLLTAFVDRNWVYLPMFIGAGLTFAGATNVCGMAALLAMMPWNKPQAAGTLATQTAQPRCNG